MKAKRILTLLLAFTLVFALCFTLAACGGGGDDKCEHTEPNAEGKCDKCGEVIDEPDEPDDPGVTPDTPTGSILLIENSSAKFHFVISSLLKEQIGTELDKLVESLNDDFVREKNVEVVLDTADTIQDVEILVGPVTTRGDGLDTDVHYLGYKGFEIKVTGNKIQVLAGSNQAYKTAFEYLETSVFCFDDYDDYITDLSVNESLSHSAPETDHIIDSITVGENDLGGYVLAINEGDEYAEKIASTANNQLYRQAGMWLETVYISDLTEGQKAFFIETTYGMADRYTKDGFVVYVDDNDNLHMECEFPEKFVATANAYIINNIANADKTSIKLDTGLNNSVNVRDIYYSDFNAKGNGTIDDFEALRACHEYANKWGHTVNADGNATYYIGNGNGSRSIEVKTDTNWNGCKFIFDDSEVQPGSAAWGTAIFHIKSDYDATDYSNSSMPFTSLAKGASDLGGWAPGYKAMLKIHNDNVKHYIRYGANQNNGNSQHEIIVVDENGNIDPMTPVQWNYETVTRMSVYRIDDKPITVTGAPDGEQALVETIFNGAPCEYTYYWRNIYITRSNTLIKNVEHIITNDIPESEGGTGAPYQGFTLVRYCSDVTVQGFTYQHPEWHYLSSNKSNRMGSYEMNASYCNNLLWRDCDQSNFFNEYGSVTFHGMMGTNYCKNLSFDNMFVCSFDAHEGVYNATLKNSVCEHLNFIGDGTITLENMTVYVDGEQHAAMSLRGDYGSTWWGDIVINGLNLKYAEETEDDNIQLIKVEWYNWDFGYSVSLPQNITINNLTVTKYKYGIDEYGERWEDDVAVNSKDILLYSDQINSGPDLSDPDAVIAGSKNINPYEGTKNITLTNADTKRPVRIIWPISPQFKDLLVTVDGEVVIDNTTDD